MVPPTKSLQRVIELSQLISKSANTLQEICDSEGYDFPDLDDPVTRESEAFRTNPEAAEAADLITTAAWQLIAAVSSPPAAIYSLAVTGVCSKHFTQAYGNCAPSLKGGADGADA